MNTKYRLLFATMLFVLSISVSAQGINLDSLLEVIQRSPDDLDKALALKKISREYFETDAQNSAILYMQQGQLLEKKLDIQQRMEKANDNISALNPHLSPVMELKQDLMEISNRVDTLQFAIHEYNRRTMSFADDIQKDTEGKASRMEFEREVQADLAKQRARNTQVVAISGLLLALLLALVFFQFYRRRQAKTNLALNKLQNKVLRSQLNPHFIFNALNSIKSFINQHPETANRYLAKFSTLMRQVLENSEEEKITLEEEIAMLENYMQLEALRLHEGFEYEIYKSDSIDTENIMLPPLILQPMVENAIWHGLKPLNRKGKIMLQFSESNGLLEVTIEDDGIGVGSTAIKTSSAEKKRSMGLQITRERIALLNRKAHAKGGLVQQLFEQGAQIKISIPVG